MKKLITVAASAAALAFGSANAVLLDFTDENNVPAANPIVGGFSVVVNALLTVTVTGDPDALRRGDGISGANCPAHIPNFACDFDGIGLITDEVTIGDRPRNDMTQEIRLQFSNDVVFETAHFLDLFINPNDDSQRETGVVELFNNGVSLGTFDAVAAQVGQPGYLEQGAPLGFPGGVLPQIDEIVFTASLKNGRDDATSDYALAGVEFRTLPDISQVPVPGALPLFLAGIGGLVVARRRRK